MFVFATLLTGVIGLASILEALDFHAVTPDPDECKLVEVGGYLHEQCFFPNTTYYMYKCPQSNSLYEMVWSFGSNCYNVVFSNLCPSDPGFYQACGHGGCAGYIELGGTPLLCGTYICYDEGDDNVAGELWETNYHCKDGACKNTDLNMAGCSSVVNTTCDGKCDAVMCSYESLCNGVRYGIWCDTRWGWDYISPRWICDRDSACKHGEDEVGCNNWTVADHTTCQHYRSAGPLVEIADRIRQTAVILKGLLFNASPRAFQLPYPSGVIVMAINFVMTTTITFALIQNMGAIFTRGSCVMDNVHHTAAPCVHWTS
eukprot:sb/3466999/